MAFMDERMKIESQIGFTVGILVGATMAAIFVLWLTPMAWYFKLFSGIGSVGIIGSLLLSLNEQIKMRRVYLDTKAEMEKMNQESNAIIENIEKEVKDK